MPLPRITYSFLLNRFGQNINEREVYKSNELYGIGALAPDDRCCCVRLPLRRKLPLRLFNAFGEFQPQIRGQREALREIALSFGLPSLLQLGKSPQRVAFCLARIEGNRPAEVGNCLGQRARDIPHQTAIAISVSPTRVERAGLVVIIYRPV